MLSELSIAPISELEPAGFGRIVPNRSNAGEVSVIAGIVDDDRLRLLEVIPDPNKVDTGERL